MNAADYCISAGVLCTFLVDLAHSIMAVHYSLTVSIVMYQEVRSSNTPYHKHLRECYHSCWMLMYSLTRLLKPYA